MKAILVIDIPLEDDDARVEYLTYNHCGDLITKGMDCKLKPLPHKLQADWYTDGYKEGFNACLDEITGEKE